MIFGYFTLFVALLIEAVGAYYSITGLAAIFSGAIVPILIMGGSLEVGKVTAAVWLKNNWHRASLQYKLYLLPAVALLMMITSMGIFGFLSKAHNDQNLVSGDVQSKIAIYDEKIKTARDNIESDRKQLRQMDDAVDQVMARSTSEQGADKSNAIRRGQAKDRANIAKDIEANQKLIAKLNDEAAPIRAEVRKVEAEVGPIKYIAKLIYSDNPDANLLESAVVWVIIMIVAVFDPLALVLILAAQQSIRWAQGEEPKPKTPIQLPKFVTRLRDRFKKKKSIDDLVDQVTVENLPPEVDINQMGIDNFITDATNVTSVTTEIIQPNLKPKRKPRAKKPVAKPAPVVKPKKPAKKKAKTAPKKVKPVPKVKPKPKAKPKAKPAVVVKPKVTRKKKVKEPVILDDSPYGYGPEKVEFVNANAPGLDASVERPGDYLTPPEQTPKPVIVQPEPVREAAPARKVATLASPEVGQRVKITPDDLTQLGNLGNPSRADFGNQFPSNPNKGDIYLRTDYLPNRSFKFNGQKWIEVDKDQTDMYAYEEAYINHLITELEAGRYDPDMLTDVEREQIQQQLGKNVQ